MYLPQQEQEGDFLHMRHHMASRRRRASTIRQEMVTGIMLAYIRFW